MPDSSGLSGVSRRSSAGRRRTAGGRPREVATDQVVGVEEPFRALAADLNGHLLQVLAGLGEVAELRGEELEAFANLGETPRAHQVDRSSFRCCSRSSARRGEVGGGASRGSGFRTPRGRGVALLEVRVELADLRADLGGFDLQPLDLPLQVRELAVAVLEQLLLLGELAVVARDLGLDAGDGRSLAVSVSSICRCSSSTEAIRASDSAIRSRVCPVARATPSDSSCSLRSLPSARSPARRRAAASAGAPG